MNETAFGPTPGVRRGGSQAYTEYRGGAELRDRLAEKLAAFTGRPASAGRELIITPGTQGASFLAIPPRATADRDRILTIMGPSKTESLSGYRLGVAFGPAHLVDRMEKLQAIVSLRAPGYSQAVLRGWFEEPALVRRPSHHRQITEAAPHLIHATWPAAP